MGNNLPKIAVNPFRTLRKLLPACARLLFKIQYVEIMVAHL